MSATWEAGNDYAREMRERRRRPPTDRHAKIPRREDRPHYTLMTPLEARKLFGGRPEPEPEPEADGVKGDRAGPAPHLRRRHYRTLRDDRFTNKKGQVIEVKAAWVGPEEHVAGGKRYRVRLDL